jgi:L-alanine-DL-glutamate epimerase-like enolase superfamily enzyme
MKITRLALFRVQLRSHLIYYMYAGKTCETVESLVLRVDTDSALSGWGEVCPIPHYLPAYAAGVRPALEELSAVLLGADPVGPEALMARCDAHLQGHVYAKSALDTALWDLTAKSEGLPLYRLLGGRQVESAPLYHSISCVAPAEMAPIAVDAQTQGIHQFQVKLGADDDWQADVARLQAVRGAVGPGPLLFGDWNCGATTLTAIRVARAVRGCDVMLEQPCESIEDCAQVRRVSGVAMKLDESVCDLGSILKAHALGCIDVAAIKLSKFGGIGAARRARDLCLELKIMIVIEDCWGSDIATAALTHLAVSTPSRYLLNACDLSGYVSPRLAADGPRRESGRLRPAERPGLGITPDTAVLGEAIAIYE